MTWFRDWFDTPLYENLYAHRDEAEAEKLAEWIYKNFPPGKFTTVLDLACGRGRHSHNLAKLGYKVTGADLSPNAINKAKENSPDDVIFPPEFIVHDMREPLPLKFDLIVNLFTSFGYFGDDASNETVIRNMTDMLRPGGGLVVDFLNRHFVLNGLVEKENQSSGDYSVEIQRKVENGMVIKEMVFNHLPSGGVSTFREEVKLYGLDWFADIFAKHGLELMETAGNYDGDAFDAERSPRLLMRALKNR